MRVLFVCGRNRLRSPAAQALVGGWPGLEAVSAGTAPDAEARVSLDVVERVVLGVPDDHGFIDPALVELLRRRLPAVLEVEAG